MDSGFFIDRKYVSMKKRHHKQPQPYTYIFPQDELKAKADMIALGMMKALENFPMQPIATREEIDAKTTREYESMKALISTNDLHLYEQIVKQWCAEGYLRNLTRYQLDEEDHKRDKRQFDALGLKSYYDLLRRNIYESLQVGTHE